MNLTSIVSDNVVSTSNSSNFGTLSRRAGLSAIAGLSCCSYAVLWWLLTVTVYLLIIGLYFIGLSGPRDLGYALF